MAEYWVSQAKHHCDFCGCWIADNKPSRDFHERGKKHIENVKLKLAEIHKNTEKKSLKDSEVEKQMKQMEEAALQALREDLKNDPSLAVQYGLDGKKIISEIEAESVPTCANKPQDYPTSTTQADTDCGDDDDAGETCVWDEAKSPEGYTYYWHTVTGEVTWIKPDNYFRSKKEKRKHEQLEDRWSSTDLGDTERNLKFQKMMRGKMGCQNIDLKEKIKTTKTVPAVKPVVVKEPRRPDIIETVSYPIGPTVGPQTKPCAYGSWETVQHDQEPEIDLQLPTVKGQEEVKVVTIVEPKVKFREKKAPPLGSELVGFKKRNPKKTNFNFRKKEDS